MHPFAALAKRTVEQYVRAGTTPDLPDDPAALRTERAGVFVSMKIHGQLRGCIGTISPSCADIGSEIIQNAVSASTRDPRFSPVTEQELESIDYSVDLLMPAEKVSDLGTLDHKRYGVIVTKDHRRGLLLPDLQGVDSVKEQLNIAMMKAGIDPSEEEINIERFEVKRYR